MDEWRIFPVHFAKKLEFRLELCYFWGRLSDFLATNHPEESK
jgi:hypothetical protein